MTADNESQQQLVGTLVPVARQRLQAMWVLFDEPANLQALEAVLDHRHDAHGGDGVQVSELNAALREKNDELLAANGDLEAFCHSVSHDLRMPLRHIHSYVALLDAPGSEKLNAEERRHVQSVQKTAQRMTRLIDDLPAFSRIGRAAMHRQRIDMDQLIDQTFQELGPDLSDRRIDWQRDAIPDSEGDPQLMKQVWLNLLANAVKYTRPRDPAKIEIGADVVDNEIIYYARDNGVGFNMKYVDRLFDVFQRAHRE